MNKEEKIEALKEQLADSEITEEQIDAIFEDETKVLDVLSTLCFIRDSYASRSRLLTISTVVDLAACVVCFLVSPLTGLLLLWGNIIATHIGLRTADKEVAEAKQHLREIGFPIADVIERKEL